MPSDRFTFVFHFCHQVRGDMSIAHIYTASTFRECDKNFQIEIDLVKNMNDVHGVSKKVFSLHDHFSHVSLIDYNIITNLASQIK